MFSVYSPKKRFNANEIEFGGKYPYVARGSENNGIRGFTTQDEKYLSEGNTISFGQDTATIYYQSKPYFTGDKIKIMKLIDTNLSENIANFLITSMRKSFSTFGWGVSSFNEEVLNNVKIKLPLTSQNEIDFSYMENYIQQIQNERFSEVKQFIKENNYENCELTEDEKKAVLDFENGNIKFAEFKIVDLFSVKNSHNILKTDIEFDSGKIPYVTASESNNSIVSYISYDLNMIEEGNSIIIGGKTLVISYQPQDFFSNDSHNLVLYLKESEKRTENIQLFLVSVLNRSLKPIYSWGDSISSKKIQSDSVFLPLTPQNTIDYAFMENYILAQKKCVMKNVVEFVG